MTTANEALRDLQNAAVDYAAAKALYKADPTFAHLEILELCTRRLANASLMHAAAVLREQAGALK